MTSAVTVLSDSEPPAGLLDAFHAYDRALLSNDVEVLDSSFAMGASTLRADTDGVWLGADAIREFRSARTAIPTRVLKTVHVRVMEPTCALIVAEVRSRRGAHGLQTQLWKLIDGDWRVTVAHVTAPQPALDTRVWRAVGTPLVPAISAGPLSGQTVAVKDLFAVQGFSIGAGVREYAREQGVEKAHAHVIRTLLESGADVTGIAQTDEFAFSIAGTNSDYGTPVNHAAPQHIPGGSTSGPAVAVARGDASIGLGTDTAGSIRVPAAYQGLWGLRTTRGIIDSTGLLPLAPSFDAIGFITASGDLLQTTIDAIAGDRADVPLDTRPLAVDRTILASVEPRLADVVEDACGTLVADDVTIGVDLDDALQAFRVVQGFEAWQQHGHWVDAHPGALSGTVRSRFDYARTISPSQYEFGLEVVDAVSTRMQELVAESVLMLPSTATSPPRIVDDADALEASRVATLRLTCLASIAGLPAVTFPCHRPDDVPAGICLISQRGSDRALVEIARRSAAALTLTPHHA